MNRKKNLTIILGLAFFMSLLICGIIGIKLAQRTRLRREAMAAYNNKDYALAERLLLQHVRANQEDEDGFVALANIYHEFGNVEMEAQISDLSKFTVSGRVGIETLDLLGLTPDCSLLMNTASQKVASVCVITTFSIR